MTKVWPGVRETETGRVEVSEAPVDVTRSVAVVARHRSQKGILALGTTAVKSDLDLYVTPRKSVEGANE